MTYFPFYSFSHLYTIHMKKIHELYNEDKPREKVIKKGVKALKNEELLSVLLGSGVQGKDVRKLSKEIISLMNEGIEKLNLDKLCQIHGLGTAKAAQILASLELSKRYYLTQYRKISTSKDVFEELRAFSDRKQEYFLTITLDGASHIIEKRTVFIGTLNQSLVHPREVFADAICDRAAGIILAHNHPSGTLTPSRADIQITERLKDVAKLVGIELLDHIILTKEGYYSFSDEGIL